MADKDCTTCNGDGTIIVRIVRPEAGPPKIITCPVCHGSRKK